MSEDRDARNEVSYQPANLDRHASLNLIESVRFASRIWEMLQPLDPSRFGVLDRHLLRLSIEKAFEAITDDATRADATKYRRVFENRVDRMLNSMGIEGYPREELENFLNRRLSPDTPAIFSQAEGTAATTTARHHMQALSRATLILRVATGACAHLLREANVSSSAVEFWSTALGEGRGLWDPNAKPTEFAELYGDVAIALQDARDWEDTIGTMPPSFASWMRDYPFATNVFGGCERVALWGLGL